MMKINKTKLIIPLALVALATSAVGVVSIAHADTGTTGTQSAQTSMQRTPPAAVGTVTAVSGNSITLTDKKTNTTYTVDATNATITKRTKPTTAPTPGTRPTPTTITVSQIAVGDTLMVQGTTSGTTITATKIADGVGGMGGGRGGRGPGVMGTVTAVSGNTVTVTGKDGKSYTVDASSSTVGKFQAITVSGIQVGDSVGIQGTVNGTSVTAKSIMDGMPAPKANGTTAGL